MTRRLALLGACLASVAAYAPGTTPATKTAQPAKRDDLSSGALERLVAGPRPTTTTTPAPSTLPPPPAAVSVQTSPSPPPGSARRRKRERAGRPRRSKAPAPGRAASSPDPDGAWACIRRRESTNNYRSRGGGAYQFQGRTWASLGGAGRPEHAEPATQDAMARRLQQRSGWGQWTAAAKCGLR